MTIREIMGEPAVQAVRTNLRILGIWTKDHDEEFQEQIASLTERLTALLDAEATGMNLGVLHAVLEDLDMAVNTQIDISEL
jgi:hypothetical protein